MINANCEICGRNKNVRNYKGKQILCGMHREQMRKHGKIRARTMSNRNDFIEKKDHYEMIIYDRFSKEKARALIDKNDKELIEKVGSWCVDTGGYAMNGSLKTALHRYLLGKKKGLEIDHINGNKMDNRRANLEFVTHSENVRRWDRKYKIALLLRFRDWIAEGKEVDEFFNQLLK